MFLYFLADKNLFRKKCVVLRGCNSNGTCRKEPPWLHLFFLLFAQNRIVRYCDCCFHAVSIHILKKFFSIYIMVLGKQMKSRYLENQVFSFLANKIFVIKKKSLKSKFRRSRDFVVLILNDRARNVESARFSSPSIHIIIFLLFLVVYVCLHYMFSIIFVIY